MKPEDREMSVCAPGRTNRAITQLVRAVQACLGARVEHSPWLAACRPPFSRTMTSFAPRAVLINAPVLVRQ